MTDTPTTELPVLEEASIERMEHELFAQIAREEELTAPAPVARNARRRRRRWMTAGGVAAAFVAGALVAPPLLGAITFSSSANLSDDMIMPASGSPFSWGDGAGLDSFESAAAPEMADTAFGVQMSSPEEAGREMIASGGATVYVKEVAAASEHLATIARENGGYVESTNIGERHYATDASMPVPPGGDYGWVSIRVPAASLTEVIAQLADLGEVRSSSVSRHDVTAQAIDLRARVEATRASVERLTELMTQTGSVSELIEAEVALSERQAQLESYEQQLAALEDQVAMSSLHVELNRITPVTQADPAGFSDGLKAGWNGLIVSLNALVVAAGFVLPWLAVAGAAVLVIWVIRRGRRSRAASAEAAAQE